MSVTILQGDVRTMLATLPAESVQCVVTSPPYFQLRDYGVAGQIGLESTPAEFVATLVGVFEEVKRVLHPSGVVFCNLGDSYSGSGKGPSGANGIGDQGRRQGFTDANRSEHVPAKSLYLIPQRFAIAMQDAGWYVRSHIAWCKTSAMPESVRDRPTSAWESIWMFTRSARYFWDQEAVRQPLKPGADHDRTRSDGGYVTDLRLKVGGGSAGGSGAFGEMKSNPAGSNLRNWWPLGPEPSREDHYAAFPSEIPRRCILAATSERGQCPACGSPWVRVVERTKGRETIAPKLAALADTGMSSNGTKGSTLGIGGRGNGGAWDEHGTKSVTLGWRPSCQCDAGDPVPQIVLDPFLGSGTTALVADQLGRNAVGVELNPNYAEMARRRISNDAGMFADVTVAS